MWPQWTEKKLEKPRTRRRKRGQKKSTSQLRLVARHMKTALRCHSVDMMAKLITLYSPIENVRRMKHYTISVFGHSLTEYKREMNTMAWDETNRRGNRDDWWWNNRRPTRSANEERKQNCKLNFIKFFLLVGNRRQFTAAELHAVVHHKIAHFISRSFWGRNFNNSKQQEWNKKKKNKENTICCQRTDNGICYRSP